MYKPREIAYKTEHERLLGMNVALTAALDQVALDREFVRRRGLLEFLRQAWRLVEPKDFFRHSGHIDAIAEPLQAVSSGQIRNLLINEPPRTTKSLLVSVFWPSWGGTGRPGARRGFSGCAEG